MAVKPSQLGSSKEQPSSLPLQLSSLAGYQNFGDYLRLKRKQFRLTQNEMAKRFSALTEQTYGYLERERRAPLVEELVPMFAVLMGLQSDKRLPPIQVIEAQTFFRLAKERIERKGKKRQSVSKEQWDRIEQELIGLVDSRQRTIVHLIADAPTDIIALESPDSRRRKALGDALKEDTSHLLEREEWLKLVSAYPDRDPQIKVVVVQAGMGAGKSHALALLVQRLAEREDLFLIPYRFLHSETMTPDDHLDEFLATLYTDLTMKATDETKQRPLAERIEQVLKAIRALDDKKVVLLLDDAQVMFPEASEWSTSWHQFFETFIKEPHQATLYMMTRTWPGWDERKRDFLLEDNLPEISVKAGIAIWKRQGFDDVEDALLQKVCSYTGTNPQAIEMLAFQARRRGYSMTWGDDSSNSTDNPHTASLKKLLEGETLFSGNLDEKSRRALLQVFSNRLSGATMRLVECLALAPLGIPFKIVFEQFEYGDESFEDLVKASFADLSMAAAGRAAVVPLVREATLQSLTKQQKAEVEQQVTGFYAYWLTTLQKFRDDAEKSALIAEMVVRYIRARQLLKAAELFICYGWLCALFGKTSRIQRVFEEYVEDNRGKAEDVPTQVGRALLQHNIKTKTGQEVDSNWRNQTYTSIHEQVLAGELALGPSATIDVMHHLLTMHLRKYHFLDAKYMLDETLVRLKKSGQFTAEMCASYLSNKARLYAQWWNKAENGYIQEEVQHLQQECIAALKECIAQWQLCLKNALPLQEHDYKFSLARSLNDYAYRSRLVDDLDGAEEAIKESLLLKKANSALPHSLAISLSEYSQILALKGNIRKALPLKEEACAILEHLASEGKTSYNSEWGVFLYEHATILKQQAHLAEAKELLDKAIPLIDKPSRESFRIKAEKEREEISLILETGQHYLLDKRWFSEYIELTSYDETSWIAFTGPFLDSEREEWDNLYPQRAKEEISARLKALIVQSQQREFTLSQEEKRAPKLWYPYIPLEEVQDRIKKLGRLKDTIEKEEINAVVRSLYTDVINEQIMRLCQYEATVLGNQDVVWQCNLSLYGRPNTHEFYIALQSLCKMVLEAQNHAKAGPIAQEVLLQLKAWKLAPHDIATMTFFLSNQEPVPSFKKELVAESERKFSALTVQRFFQDVLFKEYHAKDWKVVIEPTRATASVDVNLQKLSLPPKMFSFEKIRGFLAEEIEVHTYRSLSGLQSPLALLGSGLARYSATEEGLAYHYAQQVNRQIYGEAKSKTWVTTLATGLASGVLTPALSFYELATFFEKTFLIDDLLSEMSWDEAIIEAKQRAWLRAARTFRCVPHLEEAGCCSLKDVIYLHGYLTVKQELERTEEQKLFVGKMGIEHLSLLDELDIIRPSYPHHHLALATDLLERICQYDS